MNEFASATSPATGKPDRPGIVYTFYSYKGGVGRSMAVANVGVALALQGHKVLLVDWDLEAPGLEHYFQGRGPTPSLTADQPGVLDLLEAHGDGITLPWRDCVSQIALPDRSLDFIVAGRRDEHYRRRLQHLDWKALYEDHDVGNFIETLRDEWRQAYDFVLVDSRTGISDSGDVCTVLLPDALVLVFVTNEQNLAGVLAAYERARRVHAKLPVDRSALMALPLISRVERGVEYKESARWQKRYAEAFESICEDWLPKDVTTNDLFNLVYLPYVAQWSFGERLPWLEEEQERLDPGSLGLAYMRLATLLAKRLDLSAATATVSSESELASAKHELVAARAALRETEEQAEFERERAYREAEEAQRARERAEQEAREEGAARIRASNELQSARRWRMVLLSILVVVSFALGALGLSAIWWARGVGSAPLPAGTGLAHADPVVRRQAVLELGLRGRDARLQGATLVALLRDRDAAVRRETIRTWGRIGLTPLDAVAEFDALLLDDEIDVRHEALGLVALQGTQAEAFLSTLINLTAHEEAATRAIAVQALGNVGPGVARHIHQILSLFADVDPLVRAAAVRAVGGLERSGADHFDAVFGMREDPDATVRAVAHEVIARMGELPQMVAFLRNADPAVRGGAATAISQMGIEARPHAESVARLLADADAGVRSKAIDALIRIGVGSTHAAAIARLADDADWNVRARAVAGLGRVLPPNLQTLAAVRLALGDPHPAVRREAQRAIVALVPPAASAPR